MSASSDSETAQKESSFSAVDHSENEMEVDDNHSKFVDVSSNAESGHAEAEPESNPNDAESRNSPAFLKTEISDSNADENEADENQSPNEISDEKAANGEEIADDDSNRETPSNAENAPEIDPIFQQTLLKPIFERREKSLKELLAAMDEFSPIIPDAVTDYYLTRAGFHSSDVRVKRLLALATQKFVADIANDAYQYSRVRAQSGGALGGQGRSRAGPGTASGRTVLTMESLSGVLEDYGVNAQRPDFFH